MLGRMKRTSKDDGDFFLDIIDCALRRKCVWKPYWASVL